MARRHLLAGIDCGSYLKTAHWNGEIFHDLADVAHLASCSASLVAYRLVSNKILLDYREIGHSDNVSNNRSKSAQVILKMHIVYMQPNCPLMHK